MPIGRDAIGVLARALSLALILTGLAACSGDDEPGASRTGEGRVDLHGLVATAPGLTTLTLSEATLQDDQASELGVLLESGVLVGAPLEVSIGGRVPAEGVTLTRTYPAVLPEGATATFAFFDPELGAWHAVPSTVAADRRSVTATVDHLSLWTDMVGGAGDAIGAFAEGLEQAGAAVRSAAEATAQGIQEGAAWVAGWAFYGVGALFDVRVDAPTCEDDTPGWVDSTQSLDFDKNNPVLWCVGRDPKDPDLLVVKARVNRGFAFGATTSVASRWTYNSTFSGREMSLLLDSLVSQDAFFGEVAELVDLGPQTVGGGLEVDFGFTEKAVRQATVGKPLVTLTPPDTVGFLVSVLAGLVGTDINDKFTGWLGSIIAVGTCARAINNTDGTALGAARAALTCLNGLDDVAAKRLAVALDKRNPKAGSKANGRTAGRLVGRASIYLALVGPVFSAFNYIGERNLDPAARSMSVFTTTQAPSVPTQQVVLDPFTYDGDVIAPYALSDRRYEPALDCFDASPAGTTPDTHWCGSTASDTHNCWAPPRYPGAIACLYSPWDTEVDLFAAADLTLTPSPETPVPTALELTDGSRYDYRIGGAYDGRADSYVAAYYCDPSSACTGSYLLVDLESGASVIDTTADAWTVLVGRLGSDIDEPPKEVAVKTAYFIASPTWR